MGRNGLMEGRGKGEGKAEKRNNVWAFGGMIWVKRWVLVS